MSAARTTLVLAAVVAAGASTLWLMKPGMMQSLARNAVPVVRADSETPLYYRDPDGKPAYSLGPATTADGRAYKAVLQQEETVAFDPKPEAKAAASSKIKYYRNPMGLPDTSPVPKKDSMGMDYIPVYEGEQTDDGSVKLTPGKIQRAGVKSEPVTMRVVASMIRAPGTVQLDERRVSVISMRSESWVQKVADVTTGTQVRKGQPLMEIYSPAISAAAADFLSVRSFGSSSDTLSSGARQRLMNLDVPESAIEKMQKSRKAALAVTWTAPRDGMVLERTAIEGMRVNPGDPLFKLADVSVVWIITDLAERDLSLVRVGQTASLRARGYPGRTFEGKVAVIYPQVNRETRTVRARIELPNPDLALLPDMYVDAEINVGSIEPVLAVLESAVLDNGKKTSVFVDKGDGRLEPRLVQLGLRGGGYVEVREGLAEGDKVVISANFLIDAESNLNAALKGYSDAEPPQ